METLGIYLEVKDLIFACVRTDSDEEETNEFLEKII